MELRKQLKCVFCLTLFLSLNRVIKCQTTEQTTSHAAATTSTSPGMSSEEPVTSEAPETTVTSLPTSPPLPTTPAPTTKHYEVKDGDTVCLVMDASFVLKMPYLKQSDEMATASVPVPINATTDGQCKSNKTELLEIFFMNEPKRWKLTIDIGSLNNIEDNVLGADENINYSWEEVSLLYFVDNETFPNAKSISDEPITVKTKNGTHLFQASSKGSYKCVSQQNVEMENITLEISHFRYRAFGTTKDDNYPDSGLQECDADNKKDDDDDDTGKIVGIVVGSVVGGLIFVTILGCLIQRARRRGSYEKV